MAKQYRLTLLENSSHKSIKSFKFTKFSLVTLLASLSVLILGGVYCIFAFSPLRFTIPGYPDADSKKLAVQNAIKIDSLESSIARWELYAENLGRVLREEQTLNMDSIIQGNLTRYLSAKSREELARQDSLLREQVMRDEQFGVSGSGGKKTVPIEGMHFFAPVKGVAAERFDALEHPGVDITVPAGTVVGAALDGVVVHCCWDEQTLYTILLQHPSDIITVYGCCDKLLAKKGDKVKAGAPVAATSTEVHFELWYKNNPVDPAKYIKF